MKAKKEELKKLMFFKGLSIQAFAKQLDVTATYLGKIINRKLSPSPKLALKIASELEVNICDVFE